jgi:hypothetical protein
VRRKRGSGGSGEKGGAHLLGITVAAARVVEDGLVGRTMIPWHMVAAGGKGEGSVNGADAATSEQVCAH